MCTCKSYYKFCLNYPPPPIEKIIWIRACRHTQTSHSDTGNSPSRHWQSSHHDTSKDRQIPHIETGKVSIQTQAGNIPYPDTGKPRSRHRQNSHPSSEKGIILQIQTHGKFSIQTRENSSFRLREFLHPDSGKFLIQTRGNYSSRQRNIPHQTHTNFPS